ncbi:hypothetical protein QZH41_001228 [Actinostola sp. cb2023]|nr:hypothetical protein QZH41_001228 [Actinostola sp. cb2023]
METIRVQQGKAPIELAALESLHIAHVLEQLVRGYLTGGNSARWTRHLFQDERDVKKQNVINYFYRLEFQNRGTCHVHVLVWLNDLSRTNVSDIRGDVPWTDVHNAFLVQDLQSSKSNALPLWDGPTRVIKEIGDSEVLRISHPLDAFVRNIRGYLASVLPALQCRMDVQVTDQRAMILRYVTSYVSKSNDSQLMMEMFSTEVTPYMAAYRHLTSLRPCEPEMILQMSTVKLAWTSRTTKKLVPCKLAKFGDDAVVQQYINREDTLKEMTLLEWARKFVLGSTRSSSHTQNALVAVRYNSVYHEEFFFQDMLFNCAFRSLDDLLHCHDAILPPDLRFFAASIQRNPGRWTNAETVKERLRLECNKDKYIDNVIAFVSSQYEVLKAWEQRFITTGEITPIVKHQSFPLLAEQIGVMEYFKTMVRGRNSFYENVSCLLGMEHDPLGPFLPSDPRQLWTKSLLVHGKPEPLGDDMDFMARLAPYNCEWYSRPGMAMSMLAQTVRECMPVINDGQHIINTELAEYLTSRLRPVQDAYKRLNRKEEKKKNTPKPTTKDVYDVMKNHIVDDIQYDAVLGDAITTCSAMFTLCTQLKASRVLMRNPEIYASETSSHDN